MCKGYSYSLHIYSFGSICLKCLLRGTYLLFCCCMARRRLNLSTRPPASTNFCFPVKKGWHFEQISTVISPFVERVVATSPQAHLIVTSLYSGCKPFFMFKHLSPSHKYRRYYTMLFLKNQVFLKKSLDFLRHFLTKPLHDLFFKP